MVDFAKRVRHLAEANALSLSEVERRCGWGKGQISMTLKVNNPTVSTIVKIAEALGVAPEDLIR